MAKCPGCGEVIKFDWCHDDFRHSDGSFLNATSGTIDNDSVATNHSCKCGVWVAVSVENELGNTYFDNPHWVEVDWEDTENMW